MHMIRSILGVMGSPRNVHAVDGRKGASFMSVEWEKPNPKAEGLFTDAVQSISGYQVSSLLVDFTPCRLLIPF